MTDRIIIVDETDTPIGDKTYQELRPTDIYRVTALWLTDKKTGDILLQQRNWDKHNDPGRWQCAVAGTVDAGETYEENMIKEIAEEIGLYGLSVTKGPKEYVDSGGHKFFCQWFFASTDKETTKIVIQKSEVQAVKWIAQDALIADVTTHPDNYPPSTMHSLKTLGIVD